MVRQLALIVLALAGCASDYASTGAQPVRSSELPLITEERPFVFFGVADGSTAVPLDIIPLGIRARSPSAASALMDDVVKTVTFAQLPSGKAVGFRIRRPQPGSFPATAGEEADADVVPDGPLAPGWYRLEASYDVKALDAFPSPNSAPGKISIVFRVGPTKVPAIREIHRCGSDITLVFSEPVEPASLPQVLTINDGARAHACSLKPRAPDPKVGAAPLGEVAADCPTTPAPTAWSVGAGAFAVPANAAHYRDLACEFHMFAPSAALAGQGE